jgi:hypothetical protein
MASLNRTLQVGMGPDSECMARLQEYVDAIEAGARQGLLGDAVGRISVRYTWLETGAFTVEADAERPLRPRDRDLVVRGMANCLDMYGLELVGGPLAVTLPNQQFESELQSQRMRSPFRVMEHPRWRPDEPSHVVLEFNHAVDDDTFVTVAGVTGVFERLVWGMQPLHGDTYADIGETSIVTLESNTIRYWIFALPGDWRRRLEASLIHASRFMVASVSYEP